MVKICRLITAVMLIAYGCILASQAEARVCFATDPDCGSGGNFGNMDNLNQNDCACIAAGYNCSGTSLAACLKANIKFEIDDMRDWVAKEPISSSGQTLIGKNLTIDKLYPITTTACNPGSLKYYCPYNSACTKCCDPDFNYASCSYPLQIGGKCGDKYKCVCDSSKYKYSYDGVGSSAKCENNSTPGGTSCVHQVANSAKNGLDIETFYTECKCDRALYPYSPDVCDENAEVGDTCIAIDSTGVTSKYFSACYCDRQIYQYSAAGCSPYVGDETRGKCSSGGTTYYKACKSCEGYPAQDLEHVGYNNGTPDPEDYEVCPYRQVGNEYKIKACRDPGYRVSKDGDYDVDENGEKIKDKNGNYVRLKAGEKCIPMECEDAVKYFVGKMPQYGLFTGTSLVDHEGNAVSRTMAIVAKDISVAGKTCSTGTTVQQRVCTNFCCKYKVKAREEQEWEEDENGNELGVAIKKQQCIKSCCRSDGTNPSLTGDDLCADGVKIVTPDTWAPGTNQTCPVGSSRACMEVKEITTYDDSGLDEGDTEYELDSSCISKAYDRSDVSTPEGCHRPASMDSQVTEYNCSNVSTRSYSSVSKGMACIDASTYYSPLYLIKQLGTRSDGTKALNVACKKVPTVTYTGATFPNSGNSYGNVTLYGLNLKFSGNTNLGTRSVYLNDTNLQLAGTLTTQQSVSLTSQGYVNDGTLKVSGTNGINNGSLIIKNSFSSKGYDYEINKVEVATGLYTSVFFSGETKQKDFEVNEFRVNGLAGFNKFNVYARNTWIGNSVGKSGISLYNTNWYMYRRETYTPYYLWMQSMSYLGTPQSCGDGDFSGSVGAKIIFSNDRTYKAIADRDKQYNGEDNSRPSEHIGSVRWMSSSGSISSAACGGKGTRLLCAGAGHHHSQSNCQDDWRGGDGELQSWHNHGCRKCVYW